MRAGGLGLGVGRARGRIAGGFSVSWRAGFEGGLIPPETATSTVLADLVPNSSMGTVTFSEIADPSALFTVTGTTLVLSAVISPSSTATVTIRGTGTLKTVDRVVTVTGGAAPAGPDALTLTWDTPAYDNTPEVTFTILSPTDSDLLTVQISTSSGFSDVSETTETVPSSGGAPSSVTLTFGPLSYATHYVRAKVNDSEWVTITLPLVQDVTAPTLSAPSGAATTSRRADMSVTTNEGNGTIYAYVSTSATPPIADDIIDGLGAVFAEAQAVSSAGAKTFEATGLTASTTYYAHYVHVDAAGNVSAIVSSTAFTTDAPVPAPYTFRGSDTTFDGSLTTTHPFNLGTASPDRLVVVTVVTQTSSIAVASVTAAGVSLTLAVASQNAFIYCGTVPSLSGTQNVVLTLSSGVFTNRSLFVYTAQGLSSNTPKATGSGVSNPPVSTGMAVDPDDTVIGIAWGGNGATGAVGSETPDGFHAQTTAGLTAYCMDWLIDSAHADFAFAGDASGSTLAAAVSFV